MGLRIREMEDYLKILSHDAFRYGGGLNKSSAEIFWQLSQEQLTALQLIERTGRGKSTVFRSLKRMSGIKNTRTGEVISLVFSEDGVWNVASSVDLNRVALILGTAGIGKRKREQYKREQINHKNDLKTGSFK